MASMTSDPSTTALETLFVRDGDLLATELASQELVLLDIERGTYFGVEGVARLLWDALATPTALGGLVALLREAHPEVDAAACERDVRAFLSELHAHGLVRSVAPPAAR